MSRVTTMPKDIRLEVRARNNLILTKMEEKGVKTVAMLARRVKISAPGLYNLVNMRRLPVCKNGAWRPSVLKLSKWLGCGPDELFSAEQMEHVLDKQRSYAEISFGEVRALLAAQEADLLDPAVLVERHQAETIVHGVLSTLTASEQLVLRRRFGFDGVDYTLEEIGEELGVFKERVRQIEAKGLRKMRLSSRRGRLKAACGL